MQMDDHLYITYLFAESSETRQVFIMHIGSCNSTYLTIEICFAREMVQIEDEMS